MKTIKHTNTLVYYDRVQVFAGQDDVGAMIYTVGDANHYLVVAAAPDPLRRFYAGDLDLRTLLLESSVDGWYTALVDDDLERPEPSSRSRVHSLRWTTCPKPVFVSGNGRQKT